ncbi:MAG: hypothetical protein LBR11_09620 [Deltaproteobacteria bacterium]|jgi:hypothetical protein|nr:hypothetical protein [Deltaproteobacteria bacterium]
MIKFILFINILFIITFSFIVKADVKPISSNNKDKIYSEDIILKIITIPGISEKIKFDPQYLPYIIYNEILFPNHKYFENIEKNWFELFNTDESYKNMIISNAYVILQEASDTKDVISRINSISYNLKYKLNNLDIKKLNLPELIKNGHLGDLDSIYKLIQYYENPEIDNYNPEQFESRYWLFQAIKFGSNEALLETGYDYPYSTRTELTYQDTSVKLDIASEKLAKFNNTVKPVCFLYKLMIKNKSNYSEFIIIDDNSLSGNTIVPQKISIKKDTNNYIFIELTSYADNNPLQVRSDYFSLNGEYLLSNSKSFTPDYFWNYRKTSRLSKTKSSINSTNSAVLYSTVIRKLPYKEALLTRLFLSSEHRLKAVDNFTVKLNFEKPNYPESDELFKERSMKNFHIFSFLNNCYDRISKFLILDYTKSQNELFINKSDLVNIINRNKRFERLFSENLLASDTWWQINNDDENLKVIYNEYSKLDDFTYLITIKTEIPELNLLLVCSGIEKNNSSCYALQAKYTGENSNKSYYFITDDYTEIIFPYAYKFTLKNKKTYIYIDYLSCNHGRIKLIDVFDDFFNYIGTIHQNYFEHLLPDNEIFLELLNPDFKEWPDCSTIYKHFYPDPVDVLIEQFRKDNFYNNLTF